MAVLQEQFQKGCVSPLLYQEAVLLLNADPALFDGLDPIVRRVLVYGARKGLLNENLCGQAAELACREKYFEPVLFEILERSWEKAVPSHFAGDLFVIDQRKQMRAKVACLV